MAEDPAPSKAPTEPVPEAKPAAETTKPAPVRAKKAKTTVKTEERSKPEAPKSPAPTIRAGPIAWKSSKPAGPLAAPNVPSATVVDASGLILGRAASLIAQRLLKGEHIVVVRAEQSVVVGSRPNVLSFYTANRARGSKRTGPHYPRYPDRIFRRTVRGMLPHLKTRGKLAFDRLEVHIGCPDGLQPATPEWMNAAKARPALRPPMSLAEISRLLGAKV